jgi:hypothetical protein
MLLSISIRYYLFSYASDIQQQLYQHHRQAITGGRMKWHYLIFLLDYKLFFIGSSAWQSTTNILHINKNEEKKPDDDNTTKWWYFCRPFSPINMSE